MAKRRAPQPTDELKDCPQWSTMLALTDPALKRLDAMVRKTWRSDAGVGARRKDVLSGLILHAPEAPSALVRLAVDVRHPKYAGTSAPATRIGKIARERLVVTLPSPVSLRLNLLVHLARSEGHSAHRANLVIGLIWTGPTTIKAITKLAHDGRNWTAAQAALASGPVGAVLTSRHPNPGPLKGTG